MTKISFTTLMATLLTVAIIASGETTFPVYRLFQYDRLDKRNYSQISRHGGRRTGCEGTPIYWYDDLLTSPAAANSTLHRKIVIVDSTDAAHPLPSDLMATLVPQLNQRGASGLLFLVPKRSNLFTSEQHAAWLRVERDLVTVPEINCAAYIAFKEEASRIRPELSLTVAERRGLLVASDNPHVRSIVSTLHGKGNSANGESTGLAHPTIAVIAQYDAFSAAPALATAADGSATAVAVVLELVRGFSKLFQSKTAAGAAYNVAFVLAGGAPLNWAGMSHWAEHIPVESPVEFAICLDTVTLSNPDLFSSEKNKFYLHISKPPKERSVKRFYDSFANAAKALGLPELEIVHKKVNVARSEADWPHEALAMKRVLGATLSMLPSPPVTSDAEEGTLLARSTILDREPASSQNIATAARLVAEALARIVYPRAAEMMADDVTMIHEDIIGDDVSVRRMTEWAAQLAQTPRPFPAATAEGSPVFDALERTMRASCAETEIDDVTYVTSKKGARKQAAAAAAAAAKKGKKGSEKKNDVIDDEEDDEEIVGNERDFVMKFYVTPNGFKKAELSMTVHRRAPLLWNLYVLGITVGFLVFSRTLIRKMRRTKYD